jgi:hypothetical protein
MSAQVLRTEKFMLPSTVDGICSLIREILNGGVVQRIELDNDDTLVRVRRWVATDDLAEDTVGWDGALRNVQVMREYYDPGATSFQVIVDMFLLAHEEGLKGISWVVGDTKMIRKWLEVDKRKMPIGHIDMLHNLPVYALKTLPAETLILCCAKNLTMDPTDVVMAVKTAIDFRRDDESEDSTNSHKVGSDPEKHGATVGGLAITTRGLRRVAWDKNGSP